MHPFSEKRCHLSSPINDLSSGTLTAPIIYTFMWLIIFGGSAIKEERAAAKLGLCCTNWNMDVLKNHTLVSLSISII